MVVAGSGADRRRGRGIRLRHGKSGGESGGPAGRRGLVFHGVRSTTAGLKDGIRVSPNLADCRCISMNGAGRFHSRCSGLLRKKSTSSRPPRGWPMAGHGLASESAGGLPAGLRKRLAAGLRRRLDAGPKKAFYDATDYLVFEWRLASKNRLRFPVFSLDRSKQSGLRPFAARAFDWGPSRKIKVKESA